MNEKLVAHINEREASIMARKFPQFELFQGNSGLPFAQRGELFWGGSLETNFGASYSVAVVYPLNYPNGSIKAYVKELMEKSTPHRYLDGHLCLYSNDHEGGGEGLGLETTAATVLGWSAAWLNAWEVYKRTGDWPGK